MTTILGFLTWVGTDAGSLVPIASCFAAAAVLTIVALAPVSKPNV